MKQGWEYKKLNEVCDKGSSNIVISKLTDNNGDYPLYGASGLVKHIDFYHQDKPYIGIVKDGAGIGRVNVYPAYSSLVGTMQYIFPKKGCLLNFIKYFLVKLDLSHCVSGAIIPHIYFKDYGKEIIPVPSLETQKKIVSELDKINELICLKKEQLKDLDKLAQSIFYEMFGDPVENNREWTIQHLGDLCDKISNGYNAKLEEDTYKSEGIMYFRCQNVWRNHFDYSDLVYIDENTNQKMRSSSLKHNDFLITKIGRINTENSSLGRVSLYEGEDDKANLSGNLCFARLKQGAAVHKFILYILISNQFRNYIRRTTVGGIDKRALNVRQISSFPIISPPLPLQHLFAHRIEQIEHQKSEVQKAITDLETLLASRMQYWFE